ncbi:PH domain-containing protein [Kroppenstedtia eburnea]|uniref:PH domain-containing protein n=1 Tax=Kroppenstedtia eburnea TaxID=714067 RepID=UPI003628F454
MFGKVASDVLGLSDIGSVIKPQDYDKVDADDYVMHEDQEKIFFLIKSKADEYCFTNKALIHLDGTSATSKKRTLRRYDYFRHPISNVMLETAGTVDLDVEIKFVIGPQEYSIDVHKKHLEDLKDLYKSLLKIEEITAENQVLMDYGKESLQLASQTLSQVRSLDGSLPEQFNELNQNAFSWLANLQKQYVLKDFGFIFERFINH